MGFGPKNWVCWNGDGHPHKKKLGNTIFLTHKGRKLSRWMTPTITITNTIFFHPPYINSWQTRRKFGEFSNNAWTTL